MTGSGRLPVVVTVRMAGKKDKPRLLMVAPLPPPVHGSSMVSRYIQESRLLNEAFRMDFVNLSTSRRMEEIGRKSYGLYLKKAVRFLGSYGRVLGKLLTGHYDVCYLAITCHGVGFLKDMPFVLLCKLLGGRVLLHQHNKGMQRDAGRWPYRWLMPLVYRNTRVLLLSWRLYPDIEQVVKKEQVMVCPNGIPPLPAEAAAVRRASNRVPNILYLSNLIVSKGVYVLLDACRLLKEKGICFVCDFVGGESKEIDRSRFEAAVKERGLEGIVTYHGPKYGAEKEYFWQQADVFVFPTFYFNECFPLVLLEAMQHGVACVSTDEGGIPDIVKEGCTGLLCERQNAVSLARRLEQLLVRPELMAEYGEKGYENYQANFTLSCFENTFKACVEEMLHGKD